MFISDVIVSVTVMSMSIAFFFLIQFGKDLYFYHFAINIKTVSY